MLSDYNNGMKTFKFSLPIDVRYGDLDPQWHVNHTRFLTYLEQTRISYLIHLGLFDGKDFFNLKLIVADVQISYLAPIHLHQNVAAFMRCDKIGNKSMTFLYEIRDLDDGKVLATSKTIMVGYDYRNQIAVPISDEWRETISAFEGVDFTRMS